ncbi:MAG: hypothetical protein ACYC1Q_07720 [Bacteroidia bacterium]
MKKASELISRKNPYQDACALEGRTPLTLEQFAFLPEEERSASFSLHKIHTVIRVVKQGRKFNWNDINEWKYSALFRMHDKKGEAAGSGFACNDCDDTGAGTGVGARLCSFSSEDTKYIAEVMLEDFRTYYKE